MKISVKACEYCTHSEHDGEQYGSWSEDYDFYVDSVNVVKDDYNSAYDEDVFVISDDATNAYVIVMRYSTGDSFGQADGKGEVIHAFGNREVAQAALDVIEKQKDEWTFTFKDDFDREISYSNCGAGYFESIWSIEIETFAI